VLLDVLRRSLLGSEPISALMVAIGALALLANPVCLFLVRRHRKGGVHMWASVIFSTNDTLANPGVIAAGLLVASRGSPIPDLLIGTGISLLVLSGGRRILREAGQPPFALPLYAAMVIKVESVRPCPLHRPPLRRHPCRWRPPRVAAPCCFASCLTPTPAPTPICWWMCPAARGC
jgi:hypothetical protein